MKVAVFNTKSHDRINGGDPSYAVDQVNDYDQRGPDFLRVFANRLDIGAFELQSINSAPIAAGPARL